VEERWIVRVGYIYKYKESSEWKDTSKRLACEKRKGVWKSPCEFIQDY
jgi:hypothetical protein